MKDVCFEDSVLLRRWTAYLVVITVGDLGCHIQMRDLHHERGSAVGQYNDHGVKSGGDEERGRVRDRHNERERNRGWRCDSDNGRDRDRDRVNDRDRQYTLTQWSRKQFNIELNKQVMRISDTRELCDFVSTHLQSLTTSMLPQLSAKSWKRESLPKHRRRHYKH